MGHKINQEELSKVPEKKISLENPHEKFIIKKHADAFDFPVGRPDAIGYYNAQGYGDNSHLGEDWNGLEGGNTDLGDSIFAIANGYVKFAQNIESGWGNVIRIVHFLPESSVVESFYAHCDTVLIESNSWVDRGDCIGTIGTAGGLYPAHLHFEMRSDTSLGIGNGYSENNEGYISPSEFLIEHKK